ncbi:MAG TPA: hypothetical protein VIC51_12665 [Psychromonas sp.]
MTIKQHGGIFGRNPKFNNVTAESLIIAGNAVPDASTILVDGDIGSTVQGYDADTAKLDVAQTFTAAQTFNENIVMANTKGIDFSATANSSGTMENELFDDYEEGVWTPGYAPASGAFTSISVVTSGTYTKIGRMVYVYGTLRTTEVTIGTASGDLEITGLPFAAAGTGGGFAIDQQAWSLATDKLSPRMHVSTGNTYVKMYDNTMNGSSFPNGYVGVSDMRTAAGSFNNLIAFYVIYIA